MHYDTVFFSLTKKLKYPGKQLSQVLLVISETQKTSLESHFAGWDIHRDRFSYESHEREDAGSTPPEK